jgi:hypothetical protein
MRDLVLQMGKHHGPWIPAHPARRPGKQAPPNAEKSKSRSPTQPRSRKIEVGQPRSAWLTLPCVV